MTPEIHDGRFWLPHASCFNIRQIYQRPVFRAKGHVLFGLGHYGGFTGDRVANHPKPIFRTYHKGRDSYDPSSVSELDATLLGAESEVDVTQWGLGISYWPSAASRERGGWPVALTAEVLTASSGSGGQVPKDSQLRLQLRWFLSLW